MIGREMPGSRATTGPVGMAPTMSKPEFVRAILSRKAPGNFEDRFNARRAAELLRSAFAPGAAALCALARRWHWLLSKHELDGA